jgi:hypothetical protein
LSIGQPLDFSKSEQHSFQEWLQLSRKPIQREKEIQTTSEYPFTMKKRKKLKLIDKFIQASPKIHHYMALLHYYF